LIFATTSSIKKPAGLTDLKFENRSRKFLPRIL
jgi:hypothetical protein